MRQLTAYFAVMCLVAALVAPFLAALVWFTSMRAPIIDGQSHAPGEKISLVRPTTLWAQPADVDLSEVSCMADELGGTDSDKLKVGEAPQDNDRLTNSRGEFRFVTSTSRADFEVGSVTCTGSGLAAIATGTDVSAVKRGAAIMLLIGSPILAAIGLLLRRAGFTVARTQ